LDLTGTSKQGNQFLGCFKSHRFEGIHHGQHILDIGSGKRIFEDNQNRSFFQRLFWRSSSFMPNGFDKGHSFSDVYHFTH